MKGKKRRCYYLSYLHKAFKERPKCNAGERMVGGFWFVYACEEEGGDEGCGGVWLAATAAGQQLILSRETGSPRSGKRGGQKAMTQGVKNSRHKEVHLQKQRPHWGELV